MRRSLFIKLTNKWFSRKRQREEPGFALVIVLFSLTNLAILFANAQQNYLANINYLNAELQKLTRFDTVYSAKALAKIMVNQKISHLEFSIKDEKYEVKTQDVNGLIDLNTGEPSSLGDLLNSFGYENSEKAIRNLQSWRKTGHRFLHVTDLSKVIDLGSKVDINLGKYITVYSGRKKFAPQSASPELLERLGLVAKTGSSMVASSFRVTIQDRLGYYSSALLYSPPGTHTIKLLSR